MLVGITFEIQVGHVVSSNLCEIPPKLHAAGSTQHNLIPLWRDKMPDKSVCRMLGGLKCQDSKFMNLAMSNKDHTV